MFARNSSIFAATAAILAAGALQLATIDSAEAGKRSRSSGSSVTWSTTTPDMPRRGYEGFAGIGLGYYCSYRREPWRKCFINSYGEEQCRTVGWRKIQHCY